MSTKSELDRLARQISSKIDEGIANSLDMGRSLSKAKTELTGDKFGMLIAEVFLKAGEAKMLMAYSRRPQLSREDRKAIIDISLRQVQRGLGIKPWKKGGQAHVEPERRS